MRRVDILSCFRLTDTLWVFSIYYGVGSVLAIDCLIILRYFTLGPRFCSTFIMNRGWVLLNAFCESSELIIWFCILFMVQFMFIGIYVKSFLYFYDKANWFWLIIFLVVLKFNLQVFIDNFMPKLIWDIGL